MALFAERYTSGAGPGRADESAVPLTEPTAPLSLMNRFVVSVRCAALGVKCFSLKDGCAGQRVQRAGERRAPCRFHDCAQIGVETAFFGIFSGEWYMSQRRSIARCSEHP